MRSRFPSWVLVLYVAIDLANPFIPGAFGFTREDGVVWVEAIAHGRPTLRVGRPEASPPVPAPCLLLAEGEFPRSAERVPVPDLTAWLVDVRTGDPPTRDLAPPSSDDH